jgi:lipopolysaccharide export system permease protein
MAEERPVTILDKYISREFIKIFLLMMVSFALLYLIIDFFGRIRMFLSNHATFYQIAAHFAFGVPQIISHTLPVAVLLSTLLTFGTLSRHHEIVAMKSNGLSLYRISLPLFVLAGIVCVLSFLFNEFITPLANQKAKYIEFVEVKKQQKMGFFKQNQLWYRSRNAVYNFGFFDASSNTLRGVSIYYFDPNFQLSMKVDAREAVWKDGRWNFREVLTTTFPPGAFPVMERVPSKVMDLPEKPSDFKVVQKDTDEMGYVELRDYIRKLISEGHDASRYLVDMHGKIAFPVVCLILAVIGISFSLRSERSGGVAASIGVGIVIGFSYWIVHAFTLTLGRSLTLPPLLAAWAANILFAAAAAVMFLRVRT